MPIDSEAEYLDAIHIRQFHIARLRRVVRRRKLEVEEAEADLEDALGGLNRFTTEHAAKYPASAPADKPGEPPEARRIVILTDGTGVTFYGDDSDKIDDLARKFRTASR